MKHFVAGIRDSPSGGPSLLQRACAFCLRMLPIVGGSLFFATLKLVLVLLIDANTALEPWANYLAVLTSISLLGWLYHGKISFRTPLTRRSLLRYIQQAMALKALDYGLYNLLVYAFAVSPMCSVIMVSVLVFGLRVFAYMKYVFVQPLEVLAEDADDPRKSPWSMP